MIRDITQVLTANFGFMDHSMVEIHSTYRNFEQGLLSRGDSMKCLSGMAVFEFFEELPDGIYSVDFLDGVLRPDYLIILGDKYYGYDVTNDERTSNDFIIDRFGRGLDLESLISYMML